MVLFSYSEEAISSKMDMLELYHVTKLHDFRSYPKFHIENESKVDGINIETEPN